MQRSGSHSDRGRMNVLKNTHEKEKRLGESEGEGKTRTNHAGHNVLKEKNGDKSEMFGEEKEKKKKKSDDGKC